MEHQFAQQVNVVRDVELKIFHENLVEQLKHVLVWAGWGALVVGGGVLTFNLLTTTIKRVRSIRKR